MTARDQLSGIGITKVSQLFLSLSSVIRPLSPALSNVAMSAGFAGFQFGGLPVALTLASASVSAFAKTIFSLGSSTFQAGLSTKNFIRSFSLFKRELNGLRFSLGLVIQDAFAPAIENLGKTFKQLDTSGLEMFIFELGNIANDMSSFAGQIPSTQVIRAGLSEYTKQLLLVPFTGVTRLLVRKQIDNMFQSLFPGNTPQSTSDPLRFDRRGGIIGIGESGARIQKQLLNQSFEQRQKALDILRAIERNTNSRPNASDSSLNTNSPRAILS